MNSNTLFSSSNASELPLIISETNCLLFNLGQTTFAVEYQYVRSVIRFRKLENSPEVNQFYKGTVVFRNMLLPVMDIRLKLHPEQAFCHTSRIIILENPNHSYAGLIADSVLGVQTISSFFRLPFQCRFEQSFVKGVYRHEDQTVQILDCERMLGYSDLNYYINT